MRVEVEIGDRVTVRGSRPSRPTRRSRRRSSPHRRAATCSTGTALTPGRAREGPARLESETNSCTIPAGWTVRIDGYGNAILETA